MKGLPSVKLDIRVWILALQVCVAGCYLLIRWGWITDIFRNGVTVVEVSLEKSNCENHPLRFKLIISSTSSAKLDETGQIHLFIESRSRKSVLYAGDNTRIWKNHPLRFKLIISSASPAKLDETDQIHLLLEVAVENLYYMQEVIPEFGSKRRLQVTKFIFSTTMNMRQRKETKSSSE